MPFNKIKESIAAFKPDPPDLNRSKHIKDKEHEIRELTSGKREVNTAVNLGVLFVIVVPCVLYFNKLFFHLFNFDELISGITIAVVVSYLYGHFDEKLFAKIPFYKLNPYFGNKIEEAKNAFKKKATEDNR